MSYCVVDKIHSESNTLFCSPPRLSRSLSLSFLQLPFVRATGNYLLVVSRNSKKESGGKWGPFCTVLIRNGEKIPFLSHCKTQSSPNSYFWTEGSDLTVWVIVTNYTNFRLYFLILWRCYNDTMNITFLLNGWMLFYTRNALDSQNLICHLCL